MGIKATALLSRFFKRRDESPDEVLSTADAVALINETQQELLGMKLIRKKATLPWAADTEEIDLPEDFSAIASDRAYMDGYARVWQDYDGPDAEGLFLLYDSIRLYPAPTATTEIEFLYYAVPTDITDDPAEDEEIMGGLVAPSLGRFFIFRMLEAAAMLDEEASIAQSLQYRGDAAKAELMLWRHQVYGADQAGWVDDPLITQHQDYVDSY